MIDDGEGEKWVSDGRDVPEEQSRVASGMPHLLCFTRPLLSDKLIKRSLVVCFFEHSRQAMLAIK